MGFKNCIVLGVFSFDCIFAGVLRDLPKSKHANNGVWEAKSGHFGVVSGHFVAKHQREMVMVIWKMRR